MYTVKQVKIASTSSIVVNPYIYVSVKFVVHTMLWSPCCLDCGPVKHAASPIAQHPKVSFLWKQGSGGKNMRLWITIQGCPRGGNMVCTQILELRRWSSSLSLDFAISVWRAEVAKCHLKFWLRRHQAWCFKLLIPEKRNWKELEVSLAHWIQSFQLILTVLKLKGRRDLTSCKSQGVVFNFINLVFILSKLIYIWAKHELFGYSIFPQKISVFVWR